MDRIEVFKRWISESNRIVAFTGAGVSTESGIKDFRSKDGLYSENWRPNEQDSTLIPAPVKKMVFCFVPISYHLPHRQTVAFPVTFFKAKSALAVNPAR